MTQSGSGIPGFRLDIQQILSEAQYRWLRPAEICEILRNYKKFHISPEAPNKPVSGSVFLFDRKVLRYFRKDGHNWRKKKDGKTVKEAHEKLKVGRIDMLHCYYAHGEDNENFQRRSYWLLEQDLMHIVFVHYLEVKAGLDIQKSGKDSSLSSSFHGTSPTSPLSSTYEDAESEGNLQGSSEFRPYQESSLADDCYSSQSSSYSQPFSTGNQSIYGLNYAPLSVVHRDGKIGGGNFIPGGAPAGLASWSEFNEDHTAGKVSGIQEPACYVPAQTNWLETNNLFVEESLSSDRENGIGRVHSYLVQKAQSGNFQIPPSDEEIGNAGTQNSENSMAAFGNENYSFLLKKPLISGLQFGDSLMKVDSFSRWIAKELGEADGLDTQPSNGISWSIMGSEYEPNMSAQLQVDSETLSPSISQDQLFSIIDFSPHWAYSNMETKVLIIGMFLKSEQALSECSWSIMFGQVEVPAKVLANGILCCCAPLHITGLLPLYVTCSNRLACSEIREFEYRDELDRDTSSIDVNGGNVAQMHLCQRFEIILCLEPQGIPLISTGDDFDKQTVILKIRSLREEDHSLEEKLNSEDDPLHLGMLALEKQLKQNFFSWLLQRVAEDGKGLTIFDEWGQSVLHVAAALGFIWAFQPIIISGVKIDFRDVNGWTALHWAAFYGREKAVVALVALGAAPGYLTHPSVKHPICRTPADLASSNGHKGISGYLAETSLTTHLSTLQVNDDGTTEASGVRPFQTFLERLAAPTTEEDVPETLSLKDSLAAVCNATQAAARIHQIFRIQSFQRKQLIEQASDELLNLDDQAISLVATKISRLGHSDGMANSAALQIQKKYRGWQKRKEFLLIRQKIVKIQAYVRGHQVRKKCKHFAWSVGILEKVILRWRRKRVGLRGFQPKIVEVGASAQGISPSQEDDYAILKQGRQQVEKRMEKALARVKSMAQNPEARAQYSRLLTAAQDFSETMNISDILPDTMENMSYFVDELIDVESLMDDETFMSLTFQ